ncbi:siroheme synthase [Marinicauda pacifica]|uniref:Uroporphyrinogen-III C-methyltransferase n=1 Tax=Marinicauda pacifica TaxID=1133559 RepID=A0A4V3RZ65_9PROT|nr:siroheme synthase CysG [Marinicauda pacifica]TGY93089.1 uroporphyrinogen-III C-methyltransferase [Marinicauda pacifica]GGE42730.1 siroheme synthase [Marinicauda pacifica]
MDQFMPAIALKGARVVVIGEGEAAENKLRLFRTSPCALVWYTLDREAPAPADLKSDTEIVSGPVPETAFDRARLVFIAIEDEAVARPLADAARRAGALVNVVDNIALCDFYTPALIDRGAVTIALSTGGAAPILVRDIRSAMESVIPKGVGLLASAGRSLRGAVKQVAPGVDDRRRFWEFALRGPAARVADDGDEAGTRRALIEALDRFRDGEAQAEGIVHLVGAGPGDPELLTVRATRLIRDADVIVHDRLVSSEIIDRARRDALRIDVGKTRGQHPVPQEKIIELLIEHASQGKRVVRLKGGDSFIFGRGGEEVEAVRAAGIKVEVTPGISAALACAASTQIPLTHRDDAQAVTFVTGQPKAGGPELDYAALAAATHTVVIYMGVRTAAATAQRLIEAGRDAATPVAIIENGSRPDERSFIATLATLAETVERARLTGPAIIVIGDVVRRAPEQVPALARELKERQAA